MTGAIILAFFFAAVAVGLLGCISATLGRIQDLLIEQNREMTTGYSERLKGKFTK